ncbi:MAG: phosphatidylserine decarboxylase [Myxococcales bacterium]|nr:phosphatidylserine decarboxylase [Myxococcales bacterium]
MGGLSFSDRAARSVWRLFPKRALSGAIGWGASRGIPASLRATVLTRFARTYGIDVSEAEKPLTEYAGLDDFFTRRLRADARPIDPAPDAVVSPADGTVVACGVADDQHLIQAKGVRFTLAELLGDDELASRFRGGAYLTTYLSPRDYHRVHSPVDGGVIGWRYIPGHLFPVNAGSVRREPGLFVRNERFVSVIDGKAGLAAVVMVAAVGVGHVTASYDPDVATHGSDFQRAGVYSRSYDVPKPIARGGEVGIFHMGSTTIAVFAPGRVSLDALAPGSATKMGVRIGRLVGLRQGAES